MISTEKKARSRIHEQSPSNPPTNAPHLPTDLPSYLHYLPTYLSINLPIYQPTYLSTYLPTYLPEYTRRPLFQVTCGDIGESAAGVERKLEDHFQLAHRWGCVLLLDEADVFLEARSKTDLKRNAIVSVFLRVLEYYSGILFLTTNRVGAFDQAFRSRIHVSLFYPKTEEDATVKIWGMNFDRAEQIWGDKLCIDWQGGPQRNSQVRFEAL